MKSYEERMKWFHEARFGMFIHYGLFSLLGHGEWGMFLERIPLDEYKKLAEVFEPAPDAARQWVKLAKAAGMKYMVLTARHHDGFCLYDSQCSDYTLYKTKGRDLIREYVEACREEGMRCGIYYSLMDWRFPGYFNHRTDAESLAAMKAQCYAQVRELMTNYGPIDMLWYDGFWLNHESGTGQGYWEGEKLNAMVRELQPDIVINNRAGTREDIDTPEQVVKSSEVGRGWESCMTVGHTWGYAPYGNEYKKPDVLIRCLVQAASGEGNYLLNIGPMGDGTVCDGEKAPLLAVGEWLRQQGEGIYNSKRTAMDSWLAGCDVKGAGIWTQVGEYTYLHNFMWRGTELGVPLVDGELEEATLLSTGEKVDFEWRSNHRLTFTGLPEQPPHKACNVFKLKFKRPVEQYVPKDLSAWLRGEA